MSLQLPLEVGEGKVHVAELEGELRLEDLMGHAPAKASQLSRITARHRAIARAVAGGMRTSEVAIYFNLSQSSASLLVNDPAFKQLVEFYVRAEDDIYRSTQERLADMTNEAVDLIMERMETPETREKITIPQALQIATMGADRTGNGPQSTSVAVNINANLADRMKAAREKAMAGMKDITPPAEANE